jgi:hypothetical protein
MAKITKGGKTSVPMGGMKGTPKIKQGGGQ